MVICCECGVFSFENVKTGCSYTCFWCGGIIIGLRKEMKFCTIISKSKIALRLFLNCSNQRFGGVVLAIFTCFIADFADCHVHVDSFVL